MLECFFGLSFSHQKINDMSVSKFINDLNADINAQTYDPLSILFGKKFLELGLREKDRSVNERIKIIREFSLNKIKERVAMIEKEA